MNEAKPGNPTPGHGPVVAACSLTAEDGPVVRTAGEAARALGVDLWLVHLLAPAERPAGDAGRAGRESAREAAAARLDEMAAEAADRLAGTVIRTSVVEGVPHRGIASFAEQAAAGLIVLGADAHAERSARRLGATAERVVRRGVAPTLLVRGEPAVPLRRILGPVDLSALSNAALEQGLALLAPLMDADTTVRLFFAVSPFQGAVGERVVDYDDAMAVATDELERLGTRLGGGIPGAVESRVERGFPRELVVGEAEAFGADLVALGSHGRSGFERMLLGSIAEHVLRAAPCSVLVIPAGKPETTAPGDD